MKKVFIACLLLIGTKGLFAQVNQGQWLVGGTAGFQSVKQGSSNSAKHTDIYLNPNAGYFFIDNFAGGLRVNLSSIKYKNVDATTSYSIAPFLRYYFLPAVQKVNVFADASYGFGSYKSNGSSASFNQYAISAGPAIFLTPHTALEIALQYNSAGGDAYGGNDRQNSFGVMAGFQIHLGQGTSKK